MQTAGTQIAATQCDTRTFADGLKEVGNGGLKTRPDEPAREGLWWYRSSVFSFYAHRRVAYRIIPKHESASLEV